MDSNKNQKYLLFGKIPSIGSKTGQKRALIAVGHSILKSVYHILDGKEHYRELGADYLTGKIEAKRKTYLKKELETLGFHVELNPKPNPFGGG